MKVKNAFIMKAVDDSAVVPVGDGDLPVGDGVNGSFGLDQKSH